MNADLRFFVHYLKQNFITKRNKFCLPLIDTDSSKFIGCKYFDRLDVILAFNYLLISLKNENYIMFIKTLDSHKC